MSSYCSCHYIIAPVFIPTSLMETITLSVLTQWIVKIKECSPAKADPTKVFWCGESHTHSSQHFPGTLTLRGIGQSGLGSLMSIPQRGTQPTAPSRHVHWYLQLLWKDSPLRYTIPPNTQVAPSLAMGRRWKVVYNSDSTQQL